MLRAVCWSGALLSLAACSSQSGGAQASLEYESNEAWGRVGEPLVELSPSTPIFLDDVVVEPELPSGLTVSDTGALVGTPTESVPRTTYTVSGTVVDQRVEAAFSLAIGPQLPESIGSLEAGYVATRVVDDLQVPVKLALAPDGRIFFAELNTGRVQILSSEGVLEPSPFASIPVATGGHRGLLGLVLHPDFADNGYVYVMFTEPDLSLTVRRYTDADGSGVDPLDILTGLPGGEINNGGELIFDQDGALYVTVGDNDVAELAQEATSNAGKLLRVDELGDSLPDNPDPISPVWVSGLRNTFALAVHPETGGLFAADNGPNEDDELNFIQRGRNYAWGLEEELGATAGYMVQVWEDVITPTAITFHDGSGGWDEFAGDLFVASYNAEDIRRLELLGVAFTDLHRELPFAAFLPDAQDHKPLDLELGSDGSLWVSTFTAIYRIERYE